MPTAILFQGKHNIYLKLQLYFLKSTFITGVASLASAIAILLHSLRTEQVRSLFRPAH